MLRVARFFLNGQGFDLVSEKCDTSEMSDLIFKASDHMDLMHFYQYNQRNEM